MILSLCIITIAIIGIIHDMVSMNNTIWIHTDIAVFVTGITVVLVLIPELIEPRSMANYIHWSCIIVDVSINCRLEKHDISMSLLWWDINFHVDINYHYWYPLVN